MKYHLVTPLMIGGALLYATYARATNPLTFPSSPLAWSTCASDTFADADADVAKLKKALGERLGERLQCALMRVPLDHYHPEGPKIDVEVIRVKALIPASREGSYFIHIG